MIFMCLAHRNGKPHYRWECCSIRSQCWDTWEQAHDMLIDHRKGSEHNDISAATAKD